jgi:hypothetical protein
MDGSTPSASAGVVRRAWPRAIRVDFERAFAFLIDDFGYRRVRRRFRRNGFELAYQGPATGVIVDWYPRDPVTVWLVRLLEHEFPPRAFDYRTETELHYFDLGDLEVISGHRREPDDWQLYSPSSVTAQVMANSLRRYGYDLLRGDHSQVPLLEKRIWARVREYSHR